MSSPLIGHIEIYSTGKRYGITTADIEHKPPASKDGHYEVGGGGPVPTYEMTEDRFWVRKEIEET